MAKNLTQLKALPVFDAVARHLNYAKAADELCVTVSAVSQQIKLLEQDLGAALLNRTPSGVELTATGQHYAEHVQAGLTILRDATQKIKLHVRSSHILTVNMMNSLAMLWLIPAMPDFIEQHPDIDLRLSTNWRDINFGMDGIDLTIHYGFAKDWPQYHCQLLCQDDLILVAPPLWHTQSTEDIVQHQKAIVVAEPLRKTDLPRWFDKQHLPHPNKPMKMASSLHAIAAVKNGLGYMITHRLMVQDLLQKQEIIQIGDAIPNDKSYFIVCPEPVLSEPKAQAFLTWLNAHV